MVSVEGFSPHSIEYADNLRLSTAQAIRVSALLADYGVNPTDLAALGYVTPRGEEEYYYQTSDPGRLQRVDIVFTPYWFELFEP
jgi:flagellar motor protein MotB